ncbi:SDR family oxidoreductase [Saccharopolyspora sp. K220]|uniref:SDR family NAD(P)-dependent oxidoreductase n=1 Tax=Saccharopolyspora soli TaxID=2926618 RepID=UPI001F59FD2E|nr:SDR family NAD(P)-dependent oxidoreductase [Saccharopolyspora soli]MCI2424093.1 SDR family oxidoreductase [Saccharopolyspora soli]
MDFQLTGKRALVTGSSSGLGEATAKLLAAEGAEVVIHGRDEARAAAVAKTIREAGGAATLAIGGLDTDAGADGVATAALSDGPVDILVNNVGVFDMSMDWTTTTPDHWADIYNVNVISSVRLIQRLVPTMRERRWGRVIQIGSVTGHLSSARQPHYNATNAARDNLAQSLARELRESGVTSNSVAPGGLLTDVNKEMLIGFGKANNMGETWEEIEPNVTRALAPNDVGRIARLDEVAAAVAYLASPVAGYITGVTLHIDGGWYAQ